MSTESLHARLDAATPGPWENVGPRTGGHGYIARVGSNVVVTRAHGNVIGDTNDDAELIAHAPVDLDAALKVIEASWNLRAAMFRGDVAEARKLLPILTEGLAEFEALP